MDSYVVDYKRLKRINVPSDDKINVNHWVYLAVALLFMFIYKRIKDRKSYQQP